MCLAFSLNCLTAIHPNICFINFAVNKSN